MIAYITVLNFFELAFLITVS